VTTCPFPVLTHVFVLLFPTISAHRSGVPDQCVFLRRNLLEFPEVATDFDVIFLYLLPDLLKHHADVNDWLWAAVFVKRCILVTMRWQLQDTSTTPWSTLLVATNTEGLEHGVHVYCCET
jgi:hypothetical protein